MASRQEIGVEPSPRRKAAHRQGIKVTKTIPKPKGPIKQTPSAYLAEMKMNTDERLATLTEMYPPTVTELLDIATNSCQKDFCVSVDQALFQPFPSEVVFQQFKPHHTYEFPLNLRNNDRVARHLKVAHEDSPYFKTECQRAAGSKVAPGMEVTYVIFFTPDEKKDYHLELVCITEREKFVVPVRAVGVRALLDFPDEIHFPSAPVKYSSTKTILVRNVGDKEAKFTLHTESPYSVTPTSASLEEGHCMQVTITFLPLFVGDSSGELAVHYDTGEGVYSSLHGSSVDVNVRLDRSSIQLESTYIGLSTQRSVTLHNRSKVVVHYQWKAFSSVEEEEAQKQLQLQQFADEEVMTKDVFLERCIQNPTLRERLPIVTHSLDHKKKRFVDVERFLFCDDNIVIDPIEGDIWPNSQAEISIIFTPSEAISYSRVAYCDVTGRESRLPLRMKSQGISPRLLFSFDTLDIQNVFINSAHAYEVILENRGDIVAEYSLLPQNSHFGPFFTFSPSSGVLEPGALQAIQISFRSTKLGEFSEDFQWAVVGSLTPLSLRITGAVIGPTFQFDTAHIKYGTIPYGFPSRREVLLTNTSEIPMTYRLRVSGSEADEIEGREFEVKPKSGVLPPNYNQTIQIDFIPEAVKVYSTELVLFVAEAGKEIFSLPISAKSDVPAITLETPYLNYGRCFLQYPYTLSVTLTNPSRLPVKYEMQPPHNKRILRYTTDSSCGVIDGQSTLDLPLQIEPQVVGEVVTAAVFRILGSLYDPLEVTIHFVGEGPVVNASSTELHWGRQPVLTPLPRTVYLSNESLIPAEFECVLSRERTVFSVDPPSGVIAPQKTVKLIVTATIDDCLRFTDKVTVLVSKGVNITISLSAEGEGTTIVSRPPLQPRVDLGPHFCCTWPCRQQFTLMNRGRRLQALSWATQGFSAAKLKKMEIKRATRDVKDVGKKSRAMQESDLKRPVFRIIPDKFALEPFESCVITLEGSSNEPSSVSERLICHAIIGKNAHKERIMTVDVTANFIAPLTQFSTRELTFTTYQPPGSELLQQMKTLSIQNVSPLPFTAVLMCMYPFSFKNVRGKLQQLELELTSSQKEEVVVQFDPTYCKDCRSCREENQLVVAYRQHPLREYLSLRAEVHFPNVEFENREVDFGCILNDTETIRYIKMANTSPLEVQYKWYFLRRPPVRRQDPEQMDEGVDMQSECETDSLIEAGEEVQEGGDSGEEEGDEEVESRESTEAGESREQEEGRSEEEMIEEDTKILSGECSGRQSSHIMDTASQSFEAEGGEIGDPAGPETDTVEQESEPAIIHDIHVHIAVPDTAATPSTMSNMGREQKSIVPTGRSKQPWELVDDPFALVRIEQVFDILPLHGTLLPRESQQIQFTFYGYADIATECMAVCKVEGGPTYQIRLSGEASNVQYKFNCKHIDFGKQLYSQVLTSELMLYNSGKVDMDFAAIGVSSEAQLAPGEISVQPDRGHIPALESMTLTVQFLPGVPEVFKKIFQIQVAHLQPDEITLVGEGVFPCIGFDLPSQLTDPSCTEYESLREKAQGNLMSGRISSIGNEKHTNNEQSSVSLQLEMERLLVKQFVLDNVDSTRGKLRPSLPSYHLDFGYVVYGSVETRRVTLANTGSCPVSFNASHKHLEGTGFSLDLVSKVRALPGSPDEENLEFNVQFDPAAINCPLGIVQTLLPFNLFSGPVYSIQLSTTVTKPSLQLSRSEIDFDTVTCGQCKIITVHISNPFHVRCCWSAVTNKPTKKVPKHVPMHVRRKIKEKPPPTYFEVDPSSGTLQPEQKMDIRIRFMPTEELDYEESIPFLISQNSDSDIALHVRGQGSEPRLEFDRQLVEFPAVLPFAEGSEAEVVVSNPLPYAIEFYSLEYDKQYLEEEEILRWVKGYDKQKRLFLPPVVPGEKLPSEILRAWENAKPKLLALRVNSEDELTSAVEGSGADINQSSQLRLSPTGVDVPQKGLIEGRTPEIGSTTALPSLPELGVIESVIGLSNDVVESFSQLSMSAIDVPPVAAAIARYMGIDLSPEGAKNELRKGVAFVIDGPPMSGRTTLARSLAKKYNTALISVDELVKEMISTAQTSEGRQLRQFLIDAENERQAQEEAASVATAPTTGKKVSTKDVKDKEAKDHAAKQEDFSLPVEPFPVLPLANTDVAVPEGTLLPVPLPREAICTILETRLLQHDCKQGIVFDGVESVFTSCPAETLRMILESIHNRQHIYVANIEMELEAIKERKVQLEKEAELRAKEEERIKHEQMKEEEERAKREMDIDEDDYEALSEERRIEFDMKLLAVKKGRALTKQREREEKERLDREKEEEEKRIAEEMSKKKKGKGRKLPTAHASPSRPMSGVKPSGDPLGMASQASFASGMATPAKGKLLKSPGVVDEHVLVDPLEKRYNHYVHHRSAVETLLADWDRVARVDRPVSSEEPVESLTPVKKSNRKASTAMLKPQSPTPAPPPPPEVNRDELGVPLVKLNGNKITEELVEDISNTNDIPTPEEILKVLGLGSDGPPIAGPVTLQVYPFPLKRMKLMDQDHFTFIAASPADPNSVKPEPTPPEVQPETTVEPPVSQSRKRPESRQSPLKQTRKKASSKASSPLPGLIPEEDDKEKEAKKPSKPAKLAGYRWVVPAKGERKIKLLFSSKDCGQFDHTFNFEIVGTRQRYQLFCRGQCHVPAICPEPRSIFSSCKKFLKENDIVHKQYIFSDDLYMFGPLHTSKKRERYKEGQYPENMDRLKISNTGRITAEVSFFFRDDTNGTTYLLDPSTMTLNPGESQTLTLWAFPQKCQSYNDALVCCVKHNPNPVVYPITCTGVEPEIRFDCKQLDFKKVLLHRKQTNVLTLTNPTLLPVAWKLGGLDQLGEEFSFNQDHGIIQPRTSFPLQVSFRAAKPILVSKKAIKVEVSDVEKYMGLMHTENIAITAEAYDVAMDISFPRGADGGLDFQCIFAGSDSKLTMQLKNKGKYDIGFAFSFTKASNGKSYSDLFKLNPPQSTLYPGEKSMSVNVNFYSAKEVTIKDESILQCEVIDRHVGEHGDVIACIPIKVSAKAVFSKFGISPLSSSNFGAMVINTKKQVKFVLENKGEFEFKYAIVKEPTDSPQKIKQINKLVRGSKRDGQDSLQGSSLFKVEGGRGGRSRAEVASIRTEVASGTQKLVLGMFTIQPATGTILAGQSTTITVECVADRPGKQAVSLLIEIGDRNKDDPPVIYYIYGHVLEPEINTTDLGLIFEEHGVCQSLGVMGPQLFHREGCVGVYGEKERRFVFKSVIVGQTASARFKIINSTKIPCDAKLAISSVSSKQKSAVEVFDIDPKSKVTTVPSHSHMFVTVAFKPTAIQTYAAIFEAYPEGYRQKALTFELQGDGNLPQVEVAHPSLKNAKQQPLLVFRRLLTGQMQTLQVSLQNTGTIPATVRIQTKFGKEHYTVSIPGGDKKAVTCKRDEMRENKEKQLQRKGSAHPPLSMCLNVGETRDFLVTFRPEVAEKCRGELSVRIKDNQFETLTIQLVGEGYQDDVTIENIHGGAERGLVEFSEAKGDGFTKLQPEEVEAAHENGLEFGDFPVGETRQITFSLTNHGSQPVKFQWPSSLPGLTFSPTTGHLHPSSSKDMCVSFTSDKPVNLMQERVPGKIWKIKFREPLEKVPDWDDRHKIVRWVNIPTSATATDKPLATPAKKKVVEIESEPLHSALDDSHREMVLCVCAATDYVKYKCTTREIRFSDTLLYQTRAYKLPVSNAGQIPLSYRWTLVHMDGSPLTPQPSQLHLDRDTGSLLSEGGEVVPFSIASSSGQVLPGKEAVFSVRFSPLDVRDWECKLVCSIPHLESATEALEIVLIGKALMPYCHFELEPSDYLASRQSIGGGDSQIDPSSTRVIEFHSCGVGIKIMKRFEVINPTITGYEFNWTYVGRPLSITQPSSFKCLTPKGYVEPGKTFEMAFEFTPTAQETAESLWRFSIPSLCQSFLLVGHTTEPAVLLDRAYINFHSVKLGSTSKETVYLVNNESTEYSFDFMKKSCYSSGHRARVKVNPLQGNVKPHSRLPIEVSFTASHPQEFSFNLECRVKRKPTALHLNVKAGGYTVRMGLTFTDTHGDVVEIPLQSDANREINFGQVPVSERALGQIAISNHGDYNFQYRWTLSEQCMTPGAQGCQLVSIERAEGTVEAHGRSSCALVFAPPKKTVLKDCLLTLEVLNGPTIPISVCGQGVEPKLVFTLSEISFGMCFLHRAEMTPKTETVTITNEDNTDISVKCLFENKPHLEVESEQCLLKPGDTSSFRVTFKPTQVTSYEEKIEFEVNGLSKTRISAKGEGVPMKVELANPAQKVVHLGALRVTEKEKAKEVHKQVTIVNRSQIPITLSVSLSITSHQLQEESGVLTVEPADDMTLRAKNGTGLVTVKFAPKSRIAPFQEEVTMESCGMAQPLFMVTGSCLGQDIKLDTDHVPFGAVWQGSQSSRRILIINSGDVGASFKWDADKFAPDFSISPTEGYLSPGMEVPLDITFHPQKVDRDICRERICCEIEGSSSLHLTLSGVCTEQKPDKDALHFTTNVRSKECRQLTIHNRSSTAWRLTPIVDGEQWTGPDSISIPPNSAGHYELTYHPLTMTTESSKHHGSIFFPFPDGNGLLYNLLGTAEPPKIPPPISREIPCKTPHIELLTVENWVRRPQRFHVKRELLRPDKLDKSVSLHGMDYIDVPALGKRDYKLNFYSFKECTILAKVTFIIEATGEYTAYNVSFKSTPSGIVDTIELCTEVRKSLSHHLTITNPLNSPVTFSTFISPNITDISLPSNFIVGAQSEMTRTFEYLPLHATKTTTKVKLTLNSSELGSYQYELHLNATPPAPEPSKHFTCHLGSSQQLQCRVNNYAKGRAEYACKIKDVAGGNVDSADFHVEKSVTASGMEVTVEVTFEPSHLGDSQATLFLSSDSGGDYTIPLSGHCLPPRPEGPFTVKAGHTITIPFKNVFPQTVQFSYSVNSPAFSVKASETLKARKMCNMQVTYDAKQADPQQTKMGKLVVTSQHSAHSTSSRGQKPPPISWVYYLKGAPSL